MPIASAKSKVEISLFSIINRTTFSLVFSEPFSGIFVAVFKHIYSLITSQQPPLSGPILFSLP
jgi:hypothetical protein